MQRRIVSVLVDMNRQQTKSCVHCKCATTWIDKNCIDYTIYTWRPLYHLICSDCFWNDDEERDHECLLRKIDLEKRAEVVLQDTEVINELYSIYHNQHKNKELAIKSIFECGLRKLINQKRSDVLDVMVYKDQSASAYFTWNSKYY